MKYAFLSFLISWIFPTKEDRKTFRKLCQKSDELLETKKHNTIIQKRYKKLIKKLKKENPKRKFKVIFLCTENSKWAYQSLYETFEKHPDFDVQILVSIPTYFFEKKFKFMDFNKLLKKNYDFFKNRGMNVEYAFNPKSKQYINLKKFNPDIIFYEQPWDLPKKHSLIETSKYAFACHCSYGTAMTNASYEYELSFYKNLFRYYLDNKYIQKTLVHNGFCKENVPVCGSSKLDAYLTEINSDKIYWKTQDKKRVIWAPHHSFGQETILKYGTFDWNYEFFYNFMKEHPEIEFIVKPHPRLKQALVSENLMTQEESDLYFNSLQAMPNVQIMDSGDYFSMFRTSDLLITDCCSFLCEYLPTLKPVIHLISRYSTGYNEFGQQIIKGYYPAKNCITLQEQIDKVLFKQEDSLKSVREEILKKDIIRPEKGVSDFIVNDILKTIHRKDK